MLSNVSMSLIVMIYFAYTELQVIRAVLDLEHKFTKIKFPFEKGTNVAVVMSACLQV